jgi:hypothetical protein
MYSNSKSKSKTKLKKGKAKEQQKTITTNSRIATTSYRSYAQAKDFVNSLKLKSYKEWIEYCKSGHKPKDIPARPDQIYKNKGWISISDWLSTSYVHNTKQWRQFEEARKFIHSLKLHNTNEWHRYNLSEKKSKDIPSNPQLVYKNKGWVSWNDWLNTDNRKKFKNLAEQSEKELTTSSSQQQQNEPLPSKKIKFIGKATMMGAEKMIIYIPVNYHLDFQKYYNKKPFRVIVEEAL